MSAVSAAERLLIGLGITSPQEIDLDAIAWHLGAAVKYRHMDTADATIVGTPNRAIIAINSSTISHGQRFSLAHELGHWHHHRGQVLFCGPADIGNFAGGPLDPERQADTFASDLILPGYLSTHRYRSLKGLTLAFAREIADEFNASMTATLIKILNEDRFPIFLSATERIGGAGSGERTWFRRGGFRAKTWMYRPLRSRFCTTCQ